ncbi:chromate efflux transporter [Rhodocytophaga aerolata]|uniref:Chromate efflux transporter n=1 Tax=Rhodocytophaga aerolata TaxID=455078 RepID=A0ABT8R142_9BACT|nr:chromate efflux transporter [Rhodocytophaga aerolata]MDO1445376.1 chromate efflux transporter [Rhodocytophaga aerolata]
MYLERVTRSITPPTLLPPTHVGRIRYYIFLKDVLILALGAFGGPQAHMAMLLKYMVCKRKYLTEAELIELNALCQILPGPTSTQTITAIGFKVGGPNLAYLTLLVWIAPAVSIMTIMGLSISYLHQHNIPLNFTRFIQPMAVGFMIYAGYKIGLKVIQNKTSVLLAALAAIITYFLQSPWVTPLILLAGGLVTASQYKKHERLVEKKPLQVQWANFILFLSVAFAAAIIGGITKWLPMRLFENFYRNGSFIFGGGQVLIPLLFTEFVQFKKYLSSQEFLSGLAIAQVVPGPVFSFTAFIGTLSMRKWGIGGELLGSFMATAGIFLPGTFLIFFVYRFWNQLKQYRVIRASLEGINSASVGLIATSAILLFQPMAQSPINAGIVLGTFSLLVFTKIPHPFIILAGLLAGFVL